MAAVITAPQRNRPLRPTVGTPRPALRVLDGGRRPGEPVARSPRPVSSRPTPRVPVATRPSAAVYRRRRIAAVAVLVVVAATAWLAVVGARTVLAGASPAAPAAEATEVVPAGAGPVHVVQPGDTLWSIAEGLEPSGDVRALVDELAERAGDGPLQAGQRIPLDGLVP